MEEKKEPELPPERFANLFRDAGINSPEALMRAFRINAPAEEEKKSDAGKKS